MRIRILCLGAFGCLAFVLSAAAQELAVDDDDAAPQQTQTDSNPPVSAPPPLVAPAAGSGPIGLFGGDTRSVAHNDWRGVLVADNPVADLLEG